jgi:cytochrome oxidase assembly protein ShyY1
MTSGRRDYGFLRQPRWIAFTALVLVLVVVMLNLALWQLRRLDERRDRNDRVAAALAAEPVPIGDGEDVAEWTTVSATGTFDPNQQVLIRNRSYRGQPGYHVVTPLERADGAALLVNRGWVPLEGDDGDLDVPPPPSGEVTVVGHVRPSQRKSRFFSPSDPAEGRLDQLYRVDIPRIAEQVPYPLVPVYVELTSLDPPVEPADSTGAAVMLPVPVPPPEQGDGPHLAYAGQWVLFSACAVAGWIIVVRRRARAAPATATT